MTSVLAIDPGSQQSGFAVVDAATCRPLMTGKLDNARLRNDLLDGMIRADRVAVEMIASYGMSVGQDVFETCVWVGRFMEVAARHSDEVGLVYRKAVKLHLCHSAHAKDANVTTALIDRFASGKPNRGKGTKAEPGWFYGFAADIWQAYALAVTVADTMEGRI